MHIIKKIIRKIFHIMCYVPRRIYYSRKRKQLKNTDFTLIASDCFGGFVYHNLGLQFKSPTVNLYFGKGDFTAFVTNLKEYVAAELYEVTDHDKPFPVGELVYGGRAVRIYFMHYKTFDEAKEKWNSRKQRIDYSNIYIAQTIASGATAEDVERFNALPYKHKMLITKDTGICGEGIVTHPVFSKNNYESGEFLRYKSLISCKRYMDEIDYIGFLNEK